MSNGIFRVVLLAVAVTAFVASTTLAADANAPAEPKPGMTTVQGTVLVVKDANDVVTAVKLATKDQGVFNVKLDKEGLDLAKMAGKEVEVQGAVSKKGEENWIKVVSHKPVEKPKS